MTCRRPTSQPLTLALAAGSLGESAAYLAACGLEVRLGWELDPGHNGKAGGLVVPCACWLLPAKRHGSPCLQILPSLSLRCRSDTCFPWLPSAGPPGLLLGYRLACFAWGLGLGGNQLLRVGPWLLSYATVWSWWLLTLYFGLASIVSIKAMVVRRRGGAGSGSKVGCGRIC